MRELVINLAKTHNEQDEDYQVKEKSYRKEIRHLKETLTSYLAPGKELFGEDSTLDFEQTEIRLEVLEGVRGVVLNRLVDYLNLYSSGLDRVSVSGVKLKVNLNEMDTEERDFIKNSLLGYLDQSETIFVPDQEPDFTQEQLILNLAEYRKGDSVRKMIDYLNSKKIGDLQRVTLA